MQDENSSDVFLVIAHSAIGAISRLLSARVVGRTTEIAILRMRVAMKAGSFSGEDNARVIEELQSVTPREFHSFCRVTTASYLVYATAIIDSLLTETTRFLFFLHPDKLGSGNAVPWNEFVAARSKAPIINRAVTKRVREIAFWTLTRRLQYLDKTFGIALQLDETQLAGLQEHWDLRNRVVHDQAGYQIHLNAAESLEVSAVPVHSDGMEVSDAEFAKALKGYQLLTRELVRAVAGKELSACHSDELERTVRALDSWGAGEPSIISDGATLAAAEGSSSTSAPPEEGTV